MGATNPTNTWDPANIWGQDSQSQDPWGDWPWGGGGGAGDSGLPSWADPDAFSKYGIMVPILSGDSQKTVGGQSILDLLNQGQRSDRYKDAASLIGAFSRRRDRQSLHAG
jgi:hypothetical protein